MVLSLELGHVLENLEYLGPHTFGLRNGELEEEHADVSIEGWNLVGRVGRQDRLLIVRCLHVGVDLLQELLRDLCLL